MIQEGNSISRRNFIKYTGVAGSGLVIGLNLFTSCKPEKYKEVIPYLSSNGISIDDALAIGDHLHFLPNGKVIVTLSKNEMGQGVSTALPSMIAEELGIPWESVSISYPDLRMHLSDGTGGSTSMLDRWESMRKAGAYAKNLFLQAAAKKWSIPPTDCKVADGMVFHSNGSLQLSYQELIPEVVVPEKITTEEIEELELVKKKDFKLIGKGLPSKIIPDIVHAKHTYSIDLKKPNMKYAIIERSPSLNGKVINFDVSETLKIPGVEKVIPIGGIKISEHTHIRNGVAVIANSTWAAMKGRKALKVEWELCEKAEINQQEFIDNIYSRLNNEKGRLIARRTTSDNQPVENVEALVFSKTYEFPYQVHACMEPLNATAHWKTDSCEIWVGTQSSSKIATDIENHLGIKKENISIHTHPSGGGFGLRWSGSYAIEALLVSKASGGDLIKMCMTREDDIKNDFINPMEINEHSVKVLNKKITEWTIRGAIDNWGAVTHWIAYDVPKLKIEEVRFEGFTQVGPWRSVMANAEGFSTECFIDELAWQLEIDPLKFRLDMLTDGKMMDANHTYEINIDRFKGALELVASKADWGKPMAEKSGQGLAVYPYMHGNGYSAVVAEVSVIEDKIKVDKINLAVDCGLVINPTIVKQQMEGGIIWALSAMFYGGLDFKEGVIQRNNFHDNKVLRMTEVPEIEVHICDNKETQPWGSGEIAPPTTYAAVCNAIFAATGKRIRKLPVEQDLIT